MNSYSTVSELAAKPDRRRWNKERWAAWARYYRLLDRQEPGRMDAEITEAAARLREMEEADLAAARARRQFAARGE